MGGFSFKVSVRFLVIWISDSRVEGGSIDSSCTVTIIVLFMLICEGSRSNSSLIRFSGLPAQSAQPSNTIQVYTCAEFGVLGSGLALVLTRTAALLARAHAAILRH